MTSLWGSLSIELGSAFYRQFGDAGEAIFNHWTKDLSHFTEQELFSGLHKFKNSGSTYMSLNVFRNHCKKQTVNNISDDIAVRTLESQRKIHADISEKSKEIGGETLKGALGLMGSKKYEGES